MSVKVMSWVWDNSTSRGIDRLVLLAIADCATDTGRDAWPSIETLTKKACVDSRTVQRSIRRLTESGELTVVKNAGKNGVNVYHVVMTLAERHPGTVPPRQAATLAEGPSTPGTVPPPPRQSATQTVLEPSITRPNKKDARGTRLPDAWRPSPELVTWTRSEFPNIDGRTETAKFIDYWHSKSGKDATKLDWDATFRNWIRNAADRMPRAQRPTMPASGLSTNEQRAKEALDKARRLAEREAADEATANRRQIGA